MKRMMLLSIIVMAVLAAAADPVKSMIATRGTDNIEADPIILPDGVVAVEYLESTGSQYIDTGFYFLSRSDTIQMEYIVTDTSYNGWQWIMGANVSAASYGVRMYAPGSRCQFVYLNNGTNYPLEDQAYSIHTVLFNGQGVFGDGELKNSSSASISGRVVGYIFACNNNGTPVGGHARIFSYRHTRFGEDVLDLIPIRFLNHEGIWEGAMYDLVSGDLFMNAGSGSFLIGPDVEE